MRFAGTSAGTFEVEGAGGTRRAKGQTRMGAKSMVAAFCRANLSDVESGNGRESRHSQDAVKMPKILGWTAVVGSI